MINSRDVKDLHKALSRGAEELKKRLDALGYPMGINATYRDNEYQDYLYEQGRSRPGNIVTNAKGGQSIHNYRLAFDIHKNIKGQEFSDPKFFETAGKIWQDMGGEWGGAWASFPDRPHCQFIGPLSLSDLQKGIKLPEYTKMPWESQKEPVEEGEPLSQRYDTVEECPEWAQPTVQKLIDIGALAGVTIDALDLSEDMLRVLVIMIRCMDIYAILS